MFEYDHLPITEFYIKCNVYRNMYNTVGILLVINITIWSYIIGF